MPDVTITLRTIDQSSATVKKVNQEFKSLAPGLEKATGSMGKFVSANAGLLSVMGGVAAGAIAVGKAIYSAAKAWEEGAKIGAKLEAVLKSAGGAAGLTVGELDKMADSMARLNGVDDELVKNAEAVLLTFTKVREDAFAPTIQAALDMSAVLGGDLQGAVIQVGKAMNDFSGYTALKRAGVSFTEEQIKQIQHFKETNDLVGYQSLLLNELQTEFGGAAQAMKEAGLGGEAVALAWGNLTEEIGEQNAGWIQDFNRGLAYTFESFTAWIDKMGDAADETNRTAEAVSNYGEIGRAMIKDTYEGNKASMDYTKTADRMGRMMVKAGEMTKFYNAQLAEQPGVIEQIITSMDGWSGTLEEVSERNADLITEAIDIQAQNDKYKDSQQEILDTIAELQAKKAEMHASEKDEIAKINEQIDEQKEKYAEGAEAFGEAQGEKLVMLALEQIALQDGVAGYSAAEAEKARILLETAGIARDSAFAQALAFETTAAALANGAMKAEDLKSVLEEMSKGYTVEVAVNITERGYAGYGAGASYATGDLQYQNPQSQSVNGNWAGGMVGSFASGGKAGGWGLVGDRQGGGFIPGVSELIFGNAQVFSSRQSEKMLKSGMFGKVPGFAGGGMTAVAGQRKPWGDTLGGGDEGSGDSELSSEPVDTAMVSQALESISMDTKQEVQQIASQVEIAITTMSNQIQASNKQLQNSMDNVAAILLDRNPRVAASMFAYELEKKLR